MPHSNHSIDLATTHPMQSHYGDGKYSTGDNWTASDDFTAKDIDESAMFQYSAFQMLNFGMFIGGTFGMQPHVLQKIFVARSDAVLRKSMLMMFLASLVVIPPMLYVGIVHGAVLSGTGTSLSGSISTISTVLSWVCVGIPMCGAMPSPVCA